MLVDCDVESTFSSAASKVERLLMFAIAAGWKSEVLDVQSFDSASTVCWVVREMCLKDVDELRSRKVDL